MVSTSTGPEDTTLEAREPHKETPDDRRIQTALDMDEGDWDVLVRAANSRATTPVEALKIATRMTYGDSIINPKTEPDTGA